MSLESLRIYQDARIASEKVYEVVSSWSEFDRSSLGSQLVRSADSICHNISEGYGRSATGERLQFMFYAEGSLQEARGQLSLASDRGLIDASYAMELSFLLKRLSISIIEFCHTLLEREPTYRGSYRKRVEDRRKWRTKPKP
ncbi:MAG: four helix bundle protein [Ignavibacteriae bacterium]|nr:MAG: four helix bundle protein [Ignavibacteriota bacterium]